MPIPFFVAWNFESEVPANILATNERRDNKILKVTIKISPGMLTDSWTEFVIDFDDCLSITLKQLYNLFNYHHLCGGKDINIISDGKATIPSWDYVLKDGDYIVFSTPNWK